MKKKVIFAIATGIFAVATMFNMNNVQGNGVGDISLESIAVMAQAQGEQGGSQCRWDGYWCVLLGHNSVCYLGCDN